MSSVVQATVNVCVGFTIETTPTGAYVYLNWLGWAMNFVCKLFLNSRGVALDKLWLFCLARVVSPNIRWDKECVCVLDRLVRDCQPKRLPGQTVALCSACLGMWFLNLKLCSTPEVLVNCPSHCFTSGQWHPLYR